MLLSLVFAELFLRFALPPQTFLDPEHDDYWLTRLQVLQPPSNPPGADWIHDARLGWRMKPSWRTDGASHNSRGLRGSREYSVPAAPGVRRVVVVGDSISYGLGLRDDETFPALLERRLPAQYQVLNLGVNGYGSDQAYLMWQHEGTRYSPEVVVLGYPVDDFRRNTNRIRNLPKPRFVARHDALRLTGIPVPPLDELLAGSETSPELSGPRVWVALRWAGRKLAGRFGSNPGDAAFEEQATLSRLILRDLARSVEAHGARLAVVLFPHCAYLDYPDLERIEDAIASACEELGIPWINVREPLQRADAEMPDMRRAYLDNCHLSAVGGEIAAEATAELLERSGILSGS